MSQEDKLYFDDRRDKTSQEKKVSKYQQKTEVEDHYVLVSEPENNYFDHVTCDSGSICLLAVLGCDGTVINTESKGGVVCLLEEHVKKPLHWFICQVHANEFP